MTSKLEWIPKDYKPIARAVTGTPVCFVVDQDQDDCAAAQFFREAGCTVRFQAEWRFVFPESMTRLPAFLLSWLDSATLDHPIGAYGLITGYTEGEPVVVGFSGQRRVTTSLALEAEGLANPHAGTAVLRGAHGALLRTMKALQENFGAEQSLTALWWSKGGQGVEQRSVYIPRVNHDVSQVLYPTIDNPADYLKRFLASDSAVLLLAGPPGTGKTTLLRYLICEHALTAHLIYDEDLLHDDRLFQNFLFEDDSDIMLVEDADNVLLDRERAGNSLMARFLNVTDGLVKLPSKKVVFTTNLSDFGRVDPALLRPGRCFGVVQTRALTFTEACVVTEKYGLATPSSSDKHYTLAEIFNPSTGAQVRRVGF